jgi:hypothetical protein
MEFCQRKLGQSVCCHYQIFFIICVKELEGRIGGKSCKHEWKTLIVTTGLKTSLRLKSRSELVWTLDKYTTRLMCWSSPSFLRTRHISSRKSMMNIENVFAEFGNGILSKKTWTKCLLSLSNFFYHLCQRIGGKNWREIL